MTEKKPLDIETIAAMSRDAEWLTSDACAFVLGMHSRDGSLNTRGFMERVAHRSSFPKPAHIGGRLRWKREDVIRWAEDEAKIKRAA